MFHIGASFVSLAPIFYKSQSALILLLLLSKSQPLALGCDLVCRLTDGFDRPASFSSTHDIHRKRRSENCGVFSFDHRNTTDGFLL